MKNRRRHPPQPRLGRGRPGDGRAPNERPNAAWDAAPLRAAPHPRPERRESRAAPAAPYDAPGRNLVFGAEPVHELIAAAPDAVRTLYVQHGLESRFQRETERVRAAGGHVVSAEPGALARMAGAESRHQGVAAIVCDYNYAQFEEVLSGKPDPVLLVDGVTDPRNLGALLRSAECAGANTVVLARDRTAALTPAAIKSSAGAWVHLRIARCGNVARAIEDLKQAGYWIAALAPGGDTDLYSLDVSRRLALIVGSEGKGVREIVRKNADYIVGIPMRGKVESLNVSVAAALALFEIERRRATARTASDDESG